MRNAGRWIVAGGLSLVMVGGAVAATTRVAPEATTTFIADDSGQDLVPHGFNTASSAKSTPDGMPLFTEEQLDAEHADVGTNFVRFLISWRSVEPEKGVINQDYLDDVEDRVSWYADRGYHVMLDMHQDLWGSAISPENPGWGNGAPEWATFTDNLPVAVGDMWELVYLEPGTIRAFDHFWNTTGEHPDLVDHYASAWRAVAERFADNETVVAYDLMNEPYGGTLQGVAFESGPLTQLYQQTTDAIREVDQDSWVCVEPQAFGFNWGLPSALGAINDPRDGDARIAFCPHLYPLPMDLGDGFAGGTKDLIAGTVAQWKTNVMRTADALGQGNGPVPIILGEFGLDTTREGAEEYVRLVYETADSAGMGVTYWSRDDGSWGPYEADGTKRNLIDWVHRPYLRAADGVQSWQSDVDALTFTISGGGFAEVYLPTDVFAGEPHVEGAAIESWDAESGILTLRTSGATTVVVTP